MTNKEIEEKAFLAIRTARDLIQNVGWTQNALARDEFGTPLGIDLTRDPKYPACYCIVGALEAQNPHPEIYARVVKLIFNKTKMLPISSWNDHPNRTKKEVVDMLSSIVE